MDLKGKKAIVTGANRSIGRAIAIALAEQGADVVISYRSDEPGALETVEQIKKFGRNSRCFYADFSKIENVLSFTKEAISYLGQVDILVNNAGMLAREQIFKLTPEKMAQVFQVNTIAPFYLLQLCAKNMVDKNIKGCIINISSIAGIYTASRGLAYAASKAAMHKFTQNAALELAKYGIRVNTVAPGVIESGMNQDTSETNPKLWQEYLSRIPLQRIGTPEDISNMVLFLASDNAAWITGKVFAVDGGTVLN